MKKTFAILIFSLFSIVLLAQNENDALRYSLINYGGTARFSGLSGAYGAVGADFSSLSQNPAGIALYRKSEFTITPVLSANNTTSNYLNQTNSNSRTTAYLGNAGYIYSQNMKGQAGPLISVQFGFGINQMSRFSNFMTISGFNNENSLLTPYVNDVNAGSDWDDFGSGLAYDVNLIYNDSVSPTNQRWAFDMEYALENGGGIQQTKTTETRGSTNETVISGGANISDKLFLGITFAFPYIRYEEMSNYTEEDKNNLNDYYNSFNRYEYLNTHGSGFNFKAGFIFMPVEYLRIGGAIHTPTNFYNMSDSYYSSMNSYFSGGENYYGRSPDGYYEYELKTPLRAMGSVAVILGKYGLISADYEYIDYSDASLQAYDYSFSSENNAIRAQYTTANNLRFGAEFKAGIVALRGGYSFYGTPFRDSGNTGDRNGYSFGIGIRDKAYFVDFAYNHSSSETRYYLYSTAPASYNQIRTNAYSLTMGFRF
jgi:hypothetical protein